MAESLNLGAFARVPFINPDGTLTREALASMAIVQRRAGGLAGLVYADTITNAPAGGISATDVQAAITELDTEKQPKDATLTALAGLATAADKLAYWTGSDTASLTDLSAFIRTLLDDADAAAVRATLNLGGMSTQESNTVAITGGSVLATTGVGYNTGAGGTVTQLTSKATAVTLSKYSGEITLNNAALASDTTVSFTLTNTTIAAADQVIVTHHSAGTGGAYTVSAFPAAGSATVYVRNVTGGSLSEAIVLKFNVFKSANS